MIPKQWYVVMDSTQIRDRPVGVVRMGEKLVFWRDKRGKVSCLRDRSISYRLMARIPLHRTAFRS
jgi:phenylpropionate dioxygenase-like ring-hydroxylating dioxygenase large terminal subunit